MRTRDTLVRLHPPGIPLHTDLRFLIACDGETKSEIVVPLRNKAGRVVGVLDLDSTVEGTFDEDDRVGLERIAACLAI